MGIKATKLNFFRFFDFRQTKYFLDIHFLLLKLSDKLN